jgi:hypothetical protein
MTPAKPRAISLKDDSRFFLCIISSIYISPFSACLQRV